MNAPYPGIDYAGPGSTTNRDENTGIRYGVISCNSVGPSLYDAQEMDYGPPTCHTCGAEGITPVTELSDELKGKEWVDGEDGYACESCEECYDSDRCFPEEPIGWSVDDGEYKIINCLHNDAMIVKSPYYTYAQLCSPCVPGAGNLNHPYPPFEGHEPSLKAFAVLHQRAAGKAGFPKVFCLGWDWFDEFNPCPYPAIYRVSDGEPVPKPSVN